MKLVLVLSFARNSSFAQVPDDSEEDGKLSYVNLKRVIWHKAFFKLLETIIIYAKAGYAYTCYDGVMRWLYAFILLLSADYEEQ